MREPDTAATASTGVEQTTVDHTPAGVEQTILNHIPAGVEQTILDHIPAGVDQSAVASSPADVEQITIGHIPADLVPATASVPALRSDHAPMAVQPRAGVLLALVAALQFVCLLDFMLLLPLGPDLAAGLGFGLERLGWLTSAYALASAGSGLLALRWLDRFPRRRVLLLAFAMVVLATLGASASNGLLTLLMARSLTGICAGPALAVAMALVIDRTPPQQRGRAIATVMLGFSAAVIGGVPLALQIAHWFGWRGALLALAALAGLLWLALWRWLPKPAAVLSANPQEASAAPPVGLRSLLAQAAVRRAMGWQGLAQFSAFLLIPQFSAFFMLNLGVPRAQLGVLYALGGGAALLVVQVLGRLADRTGSALPLSLASIGMAGGMLPMLGWSAGPVAGFFVLFMAGNAGRNISLATAISAVPGPHERAGFMSLQNVVQDAAMASAALVGALLVQTGADGKLAGMDWLAGGALALSVVLALWLWRAQSMPQTGKEGIAGF